MGIIIGIIVIILIVAAVGQWKKGDRKKSKVFFILAFAGLVALVWMSAKIIDENRRFREMRENGSAQNEEAEKQPVATGKTMDQDEPQQNNSNGVVYKNTQHGFQVTLPNSWAKYKDVTVGPSDITDNSKTRIFIDLPTADKSWPISPNDPRGYASIFSITIWNSSEWAKKLDSAECKNPIPGCPQKNFVLEKNSAFVFEYGSPQDFPSDLAKICPNSDVCFNQLKNTFKLLEK